MSKILETKILNYLSYLGDSEYMVEIVTSPGAVDSLIKLLHSDNPEIVSYASLFITDFVLSGSRNNICKESWETQLRSKIIAELEHLVLINNHFIRKQVIYTLGKICSYDSVPVLLQAFHELRDRDPILLPRLVGELFWLGVENRFDILEIAIASKHYTTRWAVLELLGEFIYRVPDEEDETFLMQYKFYEQLRHDSHRFVKTEAEYKYQISELNHRKHQENMSKSEYKKLYRELNKLKPSLTFFGISLQFCNYMSRNNLSIYTIEELENFIDNKLKQEL
ncbi:HEAT repeat domain-containing protein [Calothrix sp. NIES-2098]|uniref:HEAT repeat domain-containing protein n=1 Tax=Calothrix sp. NIES-2098 TaxID=1954171 RepID=UPI000B5DD67D|nr:hypothetical protein NIES2098_01920 [Calothrix sp. NIES-2098]